MFILESVYCENPTSYCSLTEKVSGSSEAAFLSGIVVLPRENSHFLGHKRNLKNPFRP